MFPQARRIDSLRLRLSDLLPVPGRIGVLDTGLTGALVLYGVSATHAAAAILLYHAIAFWVPGLGGLWAYLRLRPRLLRVTSADSQTLSTDTATSRSQGGKPWTHSP